MCVGLGGVALFQQGRLTLDLYGERAASQKRATTGVREGDVYDAGTRLVGQPLVLGVINRSDWCETPVRHDTESARRNWLC
jgi:hypothetical protein